MAFSRSTGFHVGRSGRDAVGPGALLPAGFAVCEAFGETPPDPLLPGEAPPVRRAVETRRIEFARGRSCVRRAMAALGLQSAPILSRDRAPIWPTGVVGSISHCRNYCCAVVGRADGWAAVGLDAELLVGLDLQQQISSKRNGAGWSASATRSPEHP